MVDDKKILEYIAQLQLCSIKSKSEVPTEFNDIRQNGFYDACQNIADTIKHYVEDDPYRWHDLRKENEHLPEKAGTYYVASGYNNVHEDTAMRYFDGKTFAYNMVERNEYLYSPIAWCRVKGFVDNDVDKEKPFD